MNKIGRQDIKNANQTGNLCTEIEKKGNDVSKSIVRKYYVI